MINHCDNDFDDYDDNYDYGCIKWWWWLGWVYNHLPISASTSSVQKSVSSRRSFKKFSSVVKYGQYCHRRKLRNDKFENILSEVFPKSPLADGRLSLGLQLSQPPLWQSEWLKIFIANVIIVPFLNVNIIIYIVIVIVPVIIIYVITLP